MDQFELQGSVVIKRLRTGQTVYLSLDADKALAQAVDPDSGNVAPNWGKAENQPIVTPSAKSYSGEGVELSGHRWAYNGTTLVFNGTADSNGFKPITSGYGQGLFALKESTGQIKIVGNIASESNYVDDTLTYTGDYVMATTKMKGTISGTRTIQLFKAGASSWIGYCNPLQSQIGNGVDSTTIQTQLQCGTQIYGTDSKHPYSCKWYKNSRNTIIDGQTGTTLKVDRSMVDGQTLFICDFMVNGNVVSTDGCHVTDYADEFMLKTNVSNDLDTGVISTAYATIVLTKTQQPANVTKAIWDYAVYRVVNPDLNEGGSDSDFKPVVSGGPTTIDKSTDKSADPGTYTVSVSTNDTEKGNLTPSDVDVNFHVKFEAVLA